jgi:hypothetical protein
MPKRKRQRDRRNEADDFSFLDIAVNNGNLSASNTPSNTTPTQQAINVVGWNINEDRISSSNTIVTTALKEVLETTFDSHTQAKSHQHDQVQTPNYFDIAGVEHFPDPTQSSDNTQ